MTRGCADLGPHIENLRGYGIPVVVAINHFNGDTVVETDAVADFCASCDIRSIIARH